MANTVKPAGRSMCSSTLTHQLLVIFHVIVFLAYGVPYAMRFRRQPPAWPVVAVLAGSAIALIAFGRLVVVSSWVP